MLNIQVLNTIKVTIYLKIKMYTSQWDEHKSKQ